MHTVHHPSLMPWQGHACWRVWSSDFGAGEGFLQTWSAWRADPQRCTRLHFTAIISEPARLQTLWHSDDPHASALRAQCVGLLPGVHRLSFSDDQVLLTLWVGDGAHFLRQQNTTADSVCLDSAFPSDVYSLKALARYCQRGTCLYLTAPATGNAAVAEQQTAANAALREGLVAVGFDFGTCAHSATYAPRWEPKQRHAATAIAATGHALVVGAGLAGAAMARSLASRGWQVTVLGQGATPADGASGLRAGLFCPHVSPDDSVLSRLSRSGVRLTLQRLQALCEAGLDWGHSGVLEHCADGGTGLPAHWDSGAGAQWSHAASAAQLARAGLPADTIACWHVQAGWVRPAAFVAAQLRHPRIHFVPTCEVAQLERCPDGTWHALNAQGQSLAHADMVVLACGPATAQLLPAAHTWQLQPIRGQITWGPQAEVPAQALPPFPVNGNGNLVTHIPQPEGAAWIMGSTFERDVTALPPTAPDQAQAHRSNFSKLSSLLPAAAPAVAPWFDPADTRCQPTWAQVRCTSHDRLPIVGPVEGQPGLWVLTALGARGLTLSVLCAELMAARLHGEPLPLDAKLAQHLGTERLARMARSMQALAPEQE